MPKLKIRLLVIPISGRSSGQLIRSGVQADNQKQDALDKAKAELESIDSKLSESALALKEAKKGREDTVSFPRLSFSEDKLTDRMNERNYFKHWQRLMKLL